MVNETPAAAVVYVGWSANVFCDASLLLPDLSLHCDTLPDATVRVFESAESNQSVQRCPNTSGLNPE